MRSRATTLLAAALIAPCVVSVGAALNAQQHPPPVFRSVPQVTVETVTVKDKAGRPIEGLTPKDFSITEDGVPQTISFVEFQRVQNPTEPPQAAPPSPSAAAPSAAPPQRDAQYQISPSAPGDIRYRDRRLLILYFDVSAMPPPDLMRAYTARQQFITTQMKAQDLVAIMTFQGGAVNVKHDFTGDRAQLQEVFDTLIYGDDKDGDGI